jgi:DNA gyrase subunit A
MATRTPPSENVPEIEITQEMEQSFVDYAMSVIVSRALPDVRDGLKPVQRRIIYSMFENNIVAGSAHRKCSKVVGDVMGNYHPHGDQAIYDALVRMGQDFSLRHLLIDPQGNFGTIDDPPGAARYTECRLSKLSTHLLDGIKENTVDFSDNYSGEMQEPAVLPARFPNLLVNGSQGIAVGMATNIPPHNLGEVIDACVHVIDNPDAGSEELMQFVKGPDFPTGGFLVGTAGIRDALTSGRGSVRLRGVCDVQEIRKGRTAIIATELPYQVSIERIVAKIKELVDSRRIEGIAEVRNETSDRVGTRLVIELKSNAVPQVVLNQLYKNTPLQDSFSYNMVSLVDGVPRTLNLAEMIGYYLDHQMEVVERRTRFRLEEAQARAHILEGLIIAVDNIDEVIQVIRGSADTPEARTNLIERFELSEIQANAILDMPLRRLTALEVDKLRTELAELQGLIAELQRILDDPKVRWGIIKEELTEVRGSFNEPRRSRIVPDEGDLSLEDLIADDELIVTVSQTGYIKSVPASTYRTQARGGRGIKAAEVQGDDVIQHLVHTTAHAYLLFFTNKGVVHRLKAHAIPRQSRTAKGVLAQSVLPLEPEETVQAIIDTRDYETGRYLVMVTKLGVAKKTEFKEYDSRNQTLVAIKLIGDDEVVSVRPTSGANDMLIFTRDGMGIRFAEADLRSMGRSTQGVRGIRLREGDQVVAAVSNAEGDEVLLLSSAGYGKRTSMTEFRRQTRGGQGMKAFKLTRVRGNLVGALAVSKDGDVFLVSSAGIGIRTPIAKISRQKRDRGQSHRCGRRKRALRHRLCPRCRGLKEPAFLSCRWSTVAVS